MTGFFLFLDEITLILKAIKEVVKEDKVHEATVHEWKQHNKAQVTVEYGGKILYVIAYVDVYRNGQEGPLRYMTQESGTGRFAYNQCDFRWLSQSECDALGVPRTKCTTIPKVAAGNIFFDMERGRRDRARRERERLQKWQNTFDGWDL